MWVSGPAGAPWGRWGVSQRAAVGGECHSPAGGQRWAGTGVLCSLTGRDLRAGFAGQGTSPPETAAPKGVT